MHYASTKYGGGLCDIGGLILGSISFTSSISTGSLSFDSHVVSA